MVGGGWPGGSSRPRPSDRTPPDIPSRPPRPATLPPPPPPPPPPARPASPAPSAGAPPAQPKGKLPDHVLALLALACLASPARSADAPPAKPKVNFQDQVSAIFQARCNGCHNADKAKGGLTLETYASTMQGGGSGQVVEPGDPDGSHLFGV